MLYPLSYEGGVRAEAGRSSGRAGGDGNRTSPSYRLTAGEDGRGGAVATPEGATVQRILVVANHTLYEQHLLDELRRRKGEGPVQVHILVPASHPIRAWSEGTVLADARARLAEITACSPWRGWW